MAAGSTLRGTVSTLAFIHCVSEQNRFCISQCIVLIVQHFCRRGDSQRHHRRPLIQDQAILALALKTAM